MRKMTILAAMLLCCESFSQVTGLNQTVNVTNEYQGIRTDMDKAPVKTFVPDSLYKFTLDFDYGGFENPYRGSSDFNPFSTDLELAPRSITAKNFYMKLGAGYTLAPVLDLACTMFEKDKVKMGAHAGASSYFGNYRRMLPYGGSGWLLPDGSTFFGYDASCGAGINARVDWNNSALLADLSYEGIYSKADPQGAGYSYSQNGYSGVKVSLGVVSKLDPVTSHWRYGADLDYHFGVDMAGAKDAKVRVFEHNVGLRLFGGIRFKDGSALDIETRLDMTGGFREVASKDYMSYVATVNPKYYFSTKKVYCGVGIGVMVADGKNAGVRIGNRNFVDVFPTLKFRWSLFRNCLVLFADAGLDGNLLSARRKSLDYHYYLPDSEISIVKKFNTDFGFSGRVSNVFDYKIHAAFDRNDRAPLFKVDMTSSGAVTNLVHADFWDFNTGFDFRLKVKDFSLKGKGLARFFLTQNLPARPSTYTASLDVAYNIFSRIGLSAGVDYASPYHAGSYTTPDIIDLRCGIDYKFDRKFTLFVTGSNLLNRDNNLIPLYSRKGICVTCGILLNF